MKWIKKEDWEFEKKFEQQQMEKISDEKLEKWILEARRYGSSSSELLAKELYERNNGTNKGEGKGI